jgi:hypothetical protein
MAYYAIWPTLQGETVGFESRSANQGLSFDGQQPSGAGSLANAAKLKNQEILSTAGSDVIHLKMNLKWGVDSAPFKSKPNIEDLRYA